MERCKTQGCIYFHLVDWASQHAWAACRRQRRDKIPNADSAFELQHDVLHVSVAVCQPWVACELGSNQIFGPYSSIKPIEA
jgi:hypothetical protein